MAGTANPAAVATAMTTADWALIVSLFSFAVSLSGFVWAIWSKWVHPKARVKVSIAVMQIITDEPPDTFIGYYGYRRIAAMLRSSGWAVNVKRVERIWRCEGLKVPAKQPKKGRLWLNDGSCMRLRPEHPNHVWSYDFVEDRTHDGRKFRMLNVVDEFTRECIAIRIDRKLKSTDVIDVLSDLFILRGVPGHVR
ncbi:HTH-like domain-containing protein, partial [Bosea lathyri]